ncbi:MAG: STAS domain-containing protein [Deltaproteobacteria bacterium]|nr:STAS domain-containing protein [Deltaproteobacteria bacterium]
MQVEKRQVGNILIIHPIEARLDARVAVSFKEAMVGFIKEGNNRLILNLSDVEFIDSSGLGAIVSSLKALGLRGELAICGTRDTVLTMFKLTRMDKVFRIFSQEEEAVAALTANG